MTLRFSRVSLQYGPSDVFVIPLKQYARTEKFVIKRIDGLEAGELDLGLGQKIHEGSVLQGSRPQSRELSILLGLQPDRKVGETYSDLRSQLYGLLAPKFGYDVTFSLTNELKEVVASVSGRVKSLKSNPFDKNASSILLVMSCYSAYLTGPIYTLPDPTLQLTNPLAVFNPGNAPTGFTLQITLGNFGASSTFISFSKGTYGEILKFSPTNLFKPKDVITVSTDGGTKSAFFYRVKTGQPADGNIGNYTKYNLLPVISPTSKWFQLHGGVNTLLVKTDVDYTSSYVVDSLSFAPKYWGV